MLRLLSLFSFTFSFAWISVSSVQAASCDIPVAIAGGAQPPPLTVYKGSGLNISFIPLEQKLVKVWLDDPSRLTVDFDAPLGSATAIHLKRINPLQFPNLPASGSQTLLTAIAVDQSGKRHRYQFRLVYGEKGTPSCYGVSLIPDSSGRSHEPLLSASDEMALQRGLRVAINEGRISESQGNSSLQGKVEKYLQLRRQGIGELEARNRAGVSLALLVRLRDMGSSPLNCQDSQCLSEETKP
jgi:hypothetical protein